MRINVKNGTNAGTRVVRERPSTAWKCCNNELKPYWVKCPDCGTPRPS